MQNFGRFLAIELALLGALLAPELMCARQSFNSEQSELEKGTIVVDAKTNGNRLSNVSVTVRVHSLGQQENFDVTVDSLSVASFNGLPAGEYVIQVAASGYPTAQVSVPVAGGQVVKVSVDAGDGVPPSFLLRLTGGSSGQPPDQTRAAAPLPAGKGGSPAKGEAANGCPLAKVVENASKRMEELVGNVNRISAIEVLEHERLDKNGKVLEQEKRRFNYVAIIEETSPGALNVDEYRDGEGGASSSFPRDIASVGMPLLAMIFHPYHLSEFEMTCEGAGVWHEQPVWRVRFQQRKDRPARMSDFQVGSRTYPVLLKGTAWIDAANYQIVHLETELLEPIPQVKLYTEHQALDYGPVQFQDSKMSMWLPQEAEI
jgi:hypothetical protein